MRLTMRVAVTVVVAVAALAAASPDQSRREATLLLAPRFGFAGANLASLIEGYETAIELPSTARDGIAAIGGIWIDAPPDVYLSWAEQFVDFERGSSVQDVQKLSSPPAASDFRWLRLSEDDARELSLCRPGSCQMQLDAGSIARMAAIDWKSAGAADRGAAVLRATLLGIAERYQQDGDAALRTYHDSRAPTDTADHSAELLAEDAAAGFTPPELLEYFRDYPRNPLPGSTSYLYWTTNSFGLKPTTRLNHLVVYRGGGPNLAGVVATKMLYASHYFHGGLDFRYVVVEKPGADRFLLVALTRTRSDGLTGLTGALIGDRVRRSAIASLRNFLKFTKDSVERRHRGRIA